MVGEKGVGKTAVMKRFCCKTGSSMMAKNTLGLVNSYKITNSIECGRARLTEDSQQTIFLCHGKIVINIDFQKHQSDTFRVDIFYDARKD